MRFLLCLAAIYLGIAVAFVPSHVPGASRASSASSAAAAARAPGAAQQSKVLLAASPRRSARRAAAVGEGRGGTAGADSGLVGVIVCDHGSRRENANTMLFEVAERYRSFSGFDIVEAAHMELAEPSIQEAFDRCVAAGAQKVVLHPFFLSPGRHVTTDIPALMTAAGRRHPEVAWVVSEPLGLQELMPRVMHAAVSESVAAGEWQRCDASGDGGSGD
eukprot:g2468.t1